jgi:hypothetical protein
MNIGNLINKEMERTKVREHSSPSSHNEDYSNKMFGSQA